MEKKKLTQIVIIGSGIAFLASSVMGLGELIASSINSPSPSQNSTQSQNAQLQAEEKGFLGVLQREPNNQTALRGLVGIWGIRIQQGDVQGVKNTIEGLVKTNPNNKNYQQLLAAINQKIADTKKVGTLNTTEPKQPPKPSK